MNLIEKARNIAMMAHENQFRKYTNDKYFTHPERVAFKLQEHHYTDIVVAAAYCHDVLEDCHQCYHSDILNDLGSDVFLLVYELTNPTKGLKAPRAIRKLTDRAHARYLSPGACNIKLADRTDNLKDMLKADDDFKELYYTESECLLHSLKANQYAHHPLLNEYEEALRGLKDSLK